jgi:hypothetical protein
MVAKCFIFFIERRWERIKMILLSLYEVRGGVEFFNGKKTKKISEIK